MKKIIVFLCFVNVLLLVKNDNNVFINNAIRYRIIVSDNSVISQDLKWKINSEIIPIINEMDSSSLEKMDKSIKDNLPIIEEVVKKYTNDYKINYGNNYFPEKKYHNVKYDAGYYPSLVIYLGKSSGNNWWCFMFPPLCTIEAQKDNLSDIEYDYYFKKIINKFI